MSISQIVVYSHFDLLLLIFCLSLHLLCPRWFFIDFRVHLLHLLLRFHHVILNMVTVEWIHILIALRDIVSKLLLHLSLIIEIKALESFRLFFKLIWNSSIESIWESSDFVRIQIRIVFDLWLQVIWRRGINICILLWVFFVAFSELFIRMSHVFISFTCSVSHLFWFCLSCILLFRVSFFLNLFFILIFFWLWSICWAWVSLGLWEEWSRLFGEGFRVIVCVLVWLDLASLACINFPQSDLIFV
jgi:hypothetical protein